MVDPTLVRNIVGAVSLHFQFFQCGCAFEAASATLASAHEKIELLAEIRNLIGRVLELQAHGDGFLGTDIGATPAVGAPAAEILQDADLLADVKHENFTRRAVVGAPGATDALRGIEDRCV